MRLFGFLRPDPRLGDHLDALEKRLALLEGEMHPSRLVEWVEVTEKLKRYLQRLGAVEQRQRARENGGPEDDKTTLRRQLMAAKFPHLGE
jgi:hypothetical protein